MSPLHVVTRDGPNVRLRHWARAEGVSRLTALASKRRIILQCNVWPNVMHSFA